MSGRNEAIRAWEDEKLKRKQYLLHENRLLIAQLLMKKMTPPSVHVGKNQIQNGAPSRNMASRMQTPTQNTEAGLTDFKMMSAECEQGGGSPNLKSFCERSK